MSQQITTAFVNQYKSNVWLLTQQMQSKLEPFVRKEVQQAQYDFYEFIGPVSAAPWGPRHGDTPLMETPHMRRKVGIFPYIWADLIDKPDRLRMLIDPTGPYAQNAVMAFNRRKDDVIIQSILGSAWTGHEGNVEVPFPASQTIAPAVPQKITIDLLRQIKEMFWNNDLDEGQPLIMAVAPNSIRTLLEDDHVTSSDYNVVKALVNGDVNQFLGITFVRLTRLPVRYVTPGDPSDGFIRTNLCWIPDGVLMSVGEDINVKVTERPDKKYSTQVFVSMDIGGTRMEEIKVIKFETFESEPTPVPAP
jgi:hypothetical protein